MPPTDLCLHQRALPCPLADAAREVLLPFRAPLVRVDVDHALQKRSPEFVAGDRVLHLY